MHRGSMQLNFKPQYRHQTGKKNTLQNTTKHFSDNTHANSRMMFRSTVHQMDQNHGQSGLQLSSNIKSVIHMVHHVLGSPVRQYLYSYMYLTTKSFLYVRVVLNSSARPLFSKTIKFRFCRDFTAVFFIVY